MNGHPLQSLFPSEGVSSGLREGHSISQTAMTKRDHCSDARRTRAPKSSSLSQLAADEGMNNLAGRGVKWGQNSEGKTRNRTPNWIDTKMRERERERERERRTKGKKELPVPVAAAKTPLHSFSRFELQFKNRSGLTAAADARRRHRFTN